MSDPFSLQQACVCCTSAFLSSVLGLCWQRSTCFTGPGVYFVHGKLVAVLCVPRWFSANTVTTAPDSKHSTLTRAVLWLARQQAAVAAVDMAAQGSVLMIGVSSLCQQLDSTWLLGCACCCGVSMAHQTVPRPEKVLVILQDGRHLIGYLRTYDQFSAFPAPGCVSCACFRCATPHRQIPTPWLPHSLAGNVVLEGTVERHVANGKVADLELGLFVIRGENMVMLAEIVRPSQALSFATREVHRCAVLCVQDEGREAHVLERVLVPSDVATVLAEEHAADELAAKRKQHTSKTRWSMTD